VEELLAGIQGRQRITGTLNSGETMAKKLTIKQKYEALKQQNEALVKDVKTYVDKLRNVKMRTALLYRATEQSPSEHNSPNGPKQFNIIEVRTLITHVLTAQQLGYDTEITASDDTLTVNFIEKRPQLPRSLQFCL
jgi:hypothetical protein